MSNTRTNDATNAAATGEKKKRKAQGPRKAQPLYAFVSVSDDKKVTVNKVTKNAKDIASWVASGGLGDTSQQLITIEIPGSSAGDTASASA